MTEGFKERHKGKILPPMEGTALGKEGLLPLVRTDEVIPISFSGQVQFVTEQEALGVMGQIISVLQTRKPGVYYNGEE